MKTLRITLITIIMTALCLSLAYGAPKEEKDNNRGRERSESVHAAKQNENQRDLKQRQGQTIEEHSRWWYNPNDDRGQGNMGQVTMLSPYGHDKDSDRMELYGNRGRVIRTETTPEEPTPEPEPPPTDPTPEPPPNYPPF